MAFDKIGEYREYIMANPEKFIIFLHDTSISKTDKVWLIQDIFSSFLNNYGMSEELLISIMYFWDVPKYKYYLKLLIPYHNLYVLALNDYIIKIQTALDSKPILARLIIKIINDFIRKYHNDFVNHIEEMERLIELIKCYYHLYGNDKVIFDLFQLDYANLQIEYLEQIMQSLKSICYRKYVFDFGLKELISQSGEGISHLAIDSSYQGNERNKLIELGYSFEEYEKKDIDNPQIFKYPVEVMIVTTDGETIDLEVPELRTCDSGNTHLNILCERYDPQYRDNPRHTLEQMVLLVLRKFGEIPIIIDHSIVTIILPNTITEFLRGKLLELLGNKKILIGEIGYDFDIKSKTFASIADSNYKGDATQLIITAINNVPKTEFEFQNTTKNFL